MHMQLPVLLEKLEILFPTGKKMESSEPEVGNSSSFFFFLLPSGLNQKHTELKMP
jgi:hypothetical protein